MIKRYSDHAANERTFLAWVRTAIAVMAFGFLIERFDLFLKVAAPQLSKRQLAAHGERFANWAGLLPVIGRDETIHPWQIFYLDDFLNAFLARELSHTGIVRNLKFRIKCDTTNGTREIFGSCASLTPRAVTFTLKTVLCPILSSSAC